MTLKEWRTEKKWSQQKLADILSVKIGKTIIQQSIYKYEVHDVMPGADIGEAIRKLSKGKVTF